jgi:hypothetical protein
MLDFVVEQMGSPPFAEVVVAPKIFLHLGVIMRQCTINTGWIPTIWIYAAGDMFVNVYNTKAVFGV